MLINVRTPCIFFFFQKHLLQPACIKITGTFWRSNFALIYSGKINIRMIFAVDEISKFAWTYFRGSQLFISYTEKVNGGKRRRY